MACNCGSSNINLSDRIKELDNRIRKDMGMELGELKDVVLSIQTNGDSIEPAFLIGEDESFLDVDILHLDSGMLKPTIICKDTIQSVTILGCQMREDSEVDINEDIKSKEDSIYHNVDKSIGSFTLNGMYL